MRSLLFVPGHDERKLARALSSAADALILDLEDAVPDAEKDRAREVSAAFVVAHPERRIFVRVNSLASGLLLADLAAVVGARPFGIMLPKCEAAADLERVDAYLCALEVREGMVAGTIRVLPIVTENAGSVLNLGSYAKAAGSCSARSRLWGMLWGGEDLGTDVGVGANRDDAGRYTALFQMARSMTLLGCAATRAVAVDAVYTNFRDSEGLRAEAQEARRDGFTAKAAIHPDQVGPINEVFSPSPQALAHANEVIAAFDAAPSAGSISIGGKMLDRPHYVAARRLLDAAQTLDQPRQAESA